MLKFPHCIVLTYRATPKKSSFSKGYNSETQHFCPHVDKARECYLKNCKQTAEKCKQIFVNQK